MCKKGDTFRIGEICKESGIYKLKNCSDGSCANQSEEQRTIPLAKGNRFPPCKGCNSGEVVWEFVKKA